VKVLLLGATGFLGSWTSRALVADGAELVIVTRPGSSTWRVEPLLDRVELKVASDESLSATIEAVRPDVVLSLDWEGVAGANRDDAAQWRNLERLRTIIHAAARAGASRVIGVGSQAEYGPRTGVIGEDDPTDPVTEYGKAKLAASRLLAEESTALGIESAWVRVFSTFGPLDNPHWVLPQLAARVLRGQRAPLTDGTQRWSYLAGSDAARAFAILSTRPRSDVRGIYNLGHPDAPPLRRTIETFAGYLGRGDALDFGAIAHTKTSVMHLQPDVARLVRLGWGPARSIDQELSATAEWIMGEPTADPILHHLTLPPAPWGAPPPLDG
jgi:nucleoside-diphosphate-sugar epimerase